MREDSKAGVEGEAAAASSMDVWHQAQAWVAEYRMNEMLGSMLF